MLSFYQTMIQDQPWRLLFSNGQIYSLFKKNFLFNCVVSFRDSGGFSDFYSLVT